MNQKTETFLYELSLGLAALMGEVDAHLTKPEEQVLKKEIKLKLGDIRGYILDEVLKID